MFIVYLLSQFPVFECFQLQLEFTFSWLQIPIKSFAIGCMLHLIHSHHSPALTAKAGGDFHASLKKSCLPAPVK